MLDDEEEDEEEFDLVHTILEVFKVLCHIAIVGLLVAMYYLS